MTVAETLWEALVAVVHHAGVTVEGDRMFYAFGEYSDVVDLAPAPAQALAEAVAVSEKRWDR